MSNVCKLTGEQLMSKLVQCGVIGAIVAAATLRHPAPFKKGAAHPKRCLLFGCALTPPDKFIYNFRQFQQKIIFFEKSIDYLGHVGTWSSARFAGD